MLIHIVSQQPPSSDYLHISLNRRNIHDLNDMPLLISPFTDMFTFPTLFFTLSNQSLLVNSPLPFKMSRPVEYWLHLGDMVTSIFYFARCNRWSLKTQTFFSIHTHMVKLQSMTTIYYQTIAKMHSNLMTSVLPWLLHVLIEMAIRGVINVWECPAKIYDIDSKLE